MKTTILLCVILFLFNGTVWAISLGKYKEIKRNNDQELLEYTSIKVDGIGVGLSWANSIIEGNPLYCAPNSLSLNRNNYMQILDDEIERGDALYDEDTPIGLVLYMGLANTFPCDK